MRFDVCAHTYDEHAGPQRFFAERVAEFISSRPKEKILELGAGTGALTRYLTGMSSSNPAGRGAVDSDIGAAVLATDISPLMVERGRRAVPQALWSVVDAFNQKVPVATLQVSSGLLHWAEDPVATLIRWKQSLAPGGRMVHAIPCEPCLTEWRTLVPESPVPWRRRMEWLEVFKQAGLKVARSESWTHQAICSSALEIARSFHRTGVTGRVSIGPKRLRQALRDYDAQYGEAGGVRATWAWLAVEAA